MTFDTDHEEYFTKTGVLDNHGKFIPLDQRRVSGSIMEVMETSFGKTWTLQK